MHRTGEWILACRKGGWVNMESTTGLRYISYRPPSDSFHFLLFFLLILFLAWFALSPSITGPNQCGRSGWKNGQPLCHIHLNHFNANIGRESIDTGWAAYFLMDMLFFPPWGCATLVEIDQHPTIFLFTGMYKQIQSGPDSGGQACEPSKQVVHSSTGYWTIFSQPRKPPSSYFLQELFCCTQRQILRIGREPPITRRVVQQQGPLP